MSGFVWLITFGLFGIGWIIDVFLIPEFVEEVGAAQPHYLAWCLIINPHVPVIWRTPQYFVRELQHNKKVFHRQMLESGSSLLFDAEYPVGVAVARQSYFESSQYVSIPVPVFVMDTLIEFHAGADADRSGRPGVLLPTGRCTSANDAATAGGVRWGCRSLCSARVLPDRATRRRGRLLLTNS